MDNGIKTIEILWTGGWDSTYRIIELSFKEVIVQPIYIIGDGRTSEKLELAAMDRILLILKSKVLTKAVLLPVKLINKKDLVIDENISAAYRTIFSKTHLGPQHEWLAAYALSNPGLEIGTESGTPETSHIVDAINTFGTLIKSGDTYLLDKNKSSKEGLLILGNFEFPIIDKTERDMLKNIENWHYEDVMKEIWFCHKPINGEPCGLCHPCAVKMESKMEFLLPQRAQKRYKFQRILSKIIGVRLSNGLCRRVFRKKEK